MDDAGFTIAQSTCCLPTVPPQLLIEQEREDDSLGTAMEFPGAVRFDPSAPLMSFTSMGRNTAWEMLGELVPEIVVKEEKIDRKETMKMYMRNYRRRQKTSLDALPAHEREMVQQKQRERVRERVRRHRLRKKLRANGLSQEEIEKRLQELVPSLANSQQDFTIGWNQTKHQMAICLDVPIVKAASIGNPPSTSPNTSLRDQLPEILGSQAPFIMQRHYVPGECARPDFDRRSESYSGENEDGQSSEVKLSPSSWSTGQVGVFLEGLGLSNLKSAFERNAIDGIALLSLTTARLCNMGVGPDEIRDELLVAIDSLKKVSNS